MTEIDDNDVNCYFDTILVCLQVAFSLLQMPTWHPQDLLQMPTRHPQEAIGR